MNAEGTESSIVAAALRGNPWLVRAALCVLVLIAYGGTLGHGFIDLDDPDYVFNNPTVKAGLTVEGIVWAMTTGHMSNWHPMTWLSLMLDVQVQKWLAPVFGMVFERDDHGLFPGAFHLTNVLLHMANVLMLFGVLLTMTSRLWPSACAAALLAVHPMHVESVAWVAERKDVLSMFFMLLTLRAYVQFVRDRDGRAYGMILLWFALGLMSKPMLVTLPCAMLLLDIWPLGRVRLPGGAPAHAQSWVRLVLEKIPVFLMSIACSVATWVAQLGAGYLQDGVWMSLMLRITNACVAYVMYMSKFFWPANLAVLYPNPSHIGHPSWTMGQIAASLALLVVITIVVLVLGFRQRALVFLPVGWFWFLGTLVPVIGLVQIGRQYMADRYTYIPYIGLYIIAAWGLAYVAGRFKTMISACMAVLIVIALTIVTRSQTWHWQDSKSLFEHTIAVTTGNWFIHNNYASTLEGEGRLDDALAELNKGIDIYPEGAWLRHNLGTFYTLKLKQYYEAQVQFEKAIELEPTYAKAHHNLAAVLSVRKLTARALYHAEEAVRLMPDVVEFRTTYATLLANEGRLTDAIEQLEQIKRLEPHRAAEYDRLIAQLRAARPTAP